MKQQVTTSIAATVAFGFLLISIILLSHLPGGLSS